ncbi:hypothetical protein BH10CHL1_BH10CHL1_42030 [soil metagenome]
MNSEDVQPTGAQPQSTVPGENISNTGTTSESNRTPFERAADSAREQAVDAADAFRRGEFISEATVDAAASADDRLIGLLAYIIPVLLPVIVLLSESSNKRPFQRYHAVQSLGLSIVFALLSVAVTIGTAIIQIVPVIGWLVGVLMLCLTPIAMLMVVIAMFYYGYQAYQGKRFAIPGLTSFLREQKWV